MQKAKRDGLLLIAPPTNVKTTVNCKNTMSSSPDRKSRKSKLNLKQLRLDEEASEAVMKAGGRNFIQARYLCETAAELRNYRSKIIEPLRKHPKVGKNEPWKRAVCVCVAFLKKYRLEMTLKTVRTEFPEVSNATGFHKAEELQREFDELFDIADNLEGKTIGDKSSKLRQ